MNDTFDSENGTLSALLELADESSVNKIPTSNCKDIVGTVIKEECVELTRTCSMYKETEEGEIVSDEEVTTDPPLLEPGTIKIENSYDGTDVGDGLQDYKMDESVGYSQDDPTIFSNIGGLLINNKGLEDRELSSQEEEERRPGESKNLSEGNISFKDLNVTNERELISKDLQNMTEKVSPIKDTEDDPKILEEVKSKKIEDPIECKEPEFDKMNPEHKIGGNLTSQEQAGTEKSVAKDSISSDSSVNNGHVSSVTQETRKCSTQFNVCPENADPVQLVNPDETSIDNSQKIVTAVQNDDDTGEKDLGCKKSPSIDINKNVMDVEVVASVTQIDDTAAKDCTTPKELVSEIKEEDIEKDASKNDCCKLDATDYKMVRVEFVDEPVDYIVNDATRKDHQEPINMVSSDENASSNDLSAEKETTKKRVECIDLPSSPVSDHLDRVDVQKSNQKLRTPTPKKRIMPPVKRSPRKCSLGNKQPNITASRDDDVYIDLDELLDSNDEESDDDRISIDDDDHISIDDDDDDSEDDDDSVLESDDEIDVSSSGGDTAADAASSSSSQISTWSCNRTQRTKRLREVFIVNKKYAKKKVPRRRSDDKPKAAAANGKISKDLKDSRLFGLKEKQPLVCQLEAFRVSADAAGVAATASTWKTTELSDYFEPLYGSPWLKPLVVSFLIMEQSEPNSISEAMKNSVNRLLEALEETETTHLSQLLHGGSVSRFTLAQWVDHVMARIPLLEPDEDLDVSYVTAILVYHCYVATNNTGTRTIDID
eukprot:TRINITY_DN16645_c0_g1_i3.p1 TRINITY_DN16645_c0_g1~~TRINITY_DN16645_c0_g1_i3.p1  ORF type:complete len:841 (+),score=193.38 TRINITY_DN16645_c0_g1_i3:214-2523(+)